MKKSINLLLTLILLSVHYAQAGQCIPSGNLILLGGGVVAILLILIIIYFLSLFGILRGFFDYKYLTSIITEKAGEVGISIIILILFIALYNPGGGSNFPGLANSLFPSAFSKAYIQANYGRLAEVSYSPSYPGVLPNLPYLYTETPLYIQSAKYYVSFMRGISLMVVLFITFFSGMVHLMSSIHFYFKLKLIGFSVQLGTALAPVVHLVSTLNTGANLALGHWLLQGFILQYIECFTLDLILPIGIIMRVFSPMRGFGDVLISISIGLLIIYPLMLNLNAVHAITVYGTRLPSGEYALSKEQVVESVFGDAALRMLTYYMAYQLPILGLNQLQQRVIPFLDNPEAQNILRRFGTATIYSVFTVIFLYINWLFFLIILRILISMAYEIIFFVLVMSIIWPAINIFVTLLCTKAIAKFLGTEFNISAIARLL